MSRDLPFPGLVALAAFVLSLGSAGGLTAQDAGADEPAMAERSDPEPGTRVRVEYVDENGDTRVRLGRLGGITTDAVRIEVDRRWFGKDTVEIAHTAIQRTLVCGNCSPARSFLIATAGAALGFFAADRVFEPEPCSGFDPCVDFSRDFLMMGVGLAGGMIGLAVSSSLDDWSETPLTPNASVGLAPGPGARIALRFEFR